MPTVDIMKITSALNITTQRVGQLVPGGDAEGSSRAV
jgi:hypothetical protein